MGVSFPVIGLWFLFENRDKIDLDLTTVVLLFFMLAIALATWGTIYGMYVRYVSSANVTLSTKEQTYSNLKVVAWFSHHVIAYRDDKVIIFPTVDVIRLEIH
jgi:hypothetical protein